jgi:hypothetical protein
MSDPGEAVSEDRKQPKLSPMTGEQDSQQSRKEQRRSDEMHDLARAGAVLIQVVGVKIREGLEAIRKAHDDLLLLLISRLRHPVY